MCKFAMSNSLTFVCVIECWTDLIGQLTAANSSLQQAVQQWARLDSALSVIGSTGGQASMGGPGAQGSTGATGGQSGAQGGGLTSLNATLAAAQDALRSKYPTARL